MPCRLHEQRARALEGRNNRYHPASWFGRRVTRRLSPYITWIFVRLGISANQASVLRLVLVMTIATSFLRIEAEWWIAATLLCYVTIILDSVDGEVARLRGTASPQGTYVDEFTGMAGEGFLLSGITIGLNRMLGPHAVVFGLGAVLLMILTYSHNHLLRSIAFEWRLPAPAKDSPRPKETGWVRWGRRVASYVLIIPGLHFLPQLAAASVIDLFVPQFMLFGFLFNARLLWLALFALGLAGAAVVRCWLTVRYGIGRQL